MPGMMDTILNLGINPDVTSGIAASKGNERFALDLHRRFIQMFGNVVLGIGSARFDRLVEDQRHRSGASRSADLGPDDLRELIAEFGEIATAADGTPIADDPYVQLEQARVESQEVV